MRQRACGQYPPLDFVSCTFLRRPRAAHNLHGSVYIKRSVASRLTCEVMMRVGAAMAMPVL